MSGLQRFTRARRLTGVDPDAWYTTAEAGYFVCHSRHHVAALVRRGALPARRVLKMDNSCRYEVRGAALLELAAELDAGYSPSEEDRVERMRIASCEGEADER